MITAEESYSSIIKRFEEKTGHAIQTGSAIDMFFSAVGDGLGLAHQAIEDGKTPYIFTSLKGGELDDFGLFFDLPRNANETDATYLYRLMNWKQSAESSNTVAINDALYTLTNASYAKAVPKTKGCNTATIYIIPNEYTDETIEAAIAEVKARVAGKTSFGMHIEYTVPDIRSVQIYAAIGSANGDVALLKKTIADKIAVYINGIAPGEYLQTGTINKIGCNEANVDYFAVTSVLVDNDEIETTAVMQELTTKFLYDRIFWIEGV